MKRKTFDEFVDELQQPDYSSEAMKASFQAEKYGNSDFHRQAAQLHRHAGNLDLAKYHEKAAADREKLARTPPTHSGPVEVGNKKGINRRRGRTT